MSPSPAGRSPFIGPWQEGSKGEPGQADPQLGGVAAASAIGATAGLRGDAEQPDGQPVAEQALRRLEAAVETPFRDGLLVRERPEGGGGRGAQTHLPPNPYQALGLGGRSQHRPNAPCGAGRPGRAGARRSRVAACAPDPVRMAEGPKCASDPHVDCALQCGHDTRARHRYRAPERRTVRQVLPRRIAPRAARRRASFSSATLRFRAACRPPNSSRTWTAPLRIPRSIRSSSSRIPASGSPGLAASAQPRRILRARSVSPVVRPAATASTARPRRWSASLYLDLATLPGAPAPEPWPLHTHLPVRQVNHTTLPAIPHRVVFRS